jgi:hypothetical protein
MRKLYFLVPGTTGKFRCGGLFAELKTLELAREICPVVLVTYRQAEENTLFLDDLIKAGPLVDGIFVVSWGFDVPKLVRKLKGQRIIYMPIVPTTGFGCRRTCPL